MYLRIHHVLQPEYVSVLDLINAQLVSVKYLMMYGVLAFVKVKKGWNASRKSIDVTQLPTLQQAMTTDDCRRAHEPSAAESAKMHMSPFRRLPLSQFLLHSQQLLKASIDASKPLHLVTGNESAGANPQPPLSPMGLAAMVKIANELVRM